MLRASVGGGGGVWEGDWREGIDREFGMDMYTLLYLKRIPTRSYCRARGTLLNVAWQPGWEGSLEENGHLCTYGWISLLSTWKHYNIVNCLYSEIKWKVKKKKNTSTFPEGGRAERREKGGESEFFKHSNEAILPTPGENMPWEPVWRQKGGRPWSCWPPPNSPLTPGSVPAAWPGDLRLCEQPASLMLTPQQYSLRQWEHFAPP